jgi:hypothetical protein
MVFTQIQDMKLMLLYGVNNKKMEYPYSNCIKDFTSFSSENKQIFEFFKDLKIDYYDQEICTSLCFQNKLIDSCGCI